MLENLINLNNNIPQTDNDDEYNLLFFLNISIR